MKYFDNSEFDCQCGCGLLPHASIMEKAEIIRAAWGKPLNCVSGARCQKHTDDLRAAGIPAAKKSAHIDGIAIDLCPVNKKDIKAFHDFCKQHLIEWDLYMEDPAHTKSWAHLDERPRPNRIFLP
ncbi:MAG: hypothetical protein EOP04_19465 [Proteobacteria bacterium]|nr:MAG: hypothetical protein EOP04_19465 [Pseudomonadota bacterium]